MKQLLFTGMILLLFLAPACKKDKDETPPPSVVGFWEGKYGNGNTVPGLPYFFLFRSNGTVRVYADNSDTTAAGKAEGTYIVTGATVKTTYTYPPSTSYSTTASVDAGFSAMDGTWGSGANTSGNGTFRIFKK
ncbi:hypothetical protein [Niabella beijingensis]|uniref:hypothetical protein n=1 Tax=Niabella beijingensis TaxID=2872700 RepID=UPI001CC14306|nr:hypothetical protein [Niabella beijingensis]MBZ4189635.1 hypothetical protein [Niabella beijingensis]